jgi:hypothetical protein
MSPQAAIFVALLRRNPFGAICTVLIVALTVASWFLWQQIADMELTRQDRAKEGEAMLELLVSGSTQRQELAVAREATHRIEDNLVIEGMLAENLWYFYKFEEQTKSRLPRLNQLNSPTTDTSPLYRRVPYTLAVSGTYEQVASFLLAIESGPRLAKINSFTLSRRSSGSDAVALELALELLGKK